MTAIAQPSFQMMAFEAIAHTRHAGKGASRAAIANFIKGNYSVKAEGAHFNAALRGALNKAVDDGSLEHGSTTQRFKLTQKGRDARKPKPKRKKKKKAAKKKKKPAKKKKKAPAKKKKTTRRKKR